jgi:acyl carrier protein
MPTSTAPTPARLSPDTDTAVAANIGNKVREFLRENFLYLRPDLHLGDDDRLLERGIIDSMGIVELITFLEESFDVQIAEDEISEANLGSLSAIIGFVAAKVAARPR